jgi:hypothetical protein
MTRVATEYGSDGSTLIRTLDDNGDGTGVMSVYGPDGSVVATEVVQLFAPEPEPLEPVGALAALLACLDVVTVEDAANAVRLTPAALEDEVLAWSLGHMGTP